MEKQALNKQKIVQKNALIMSIARLKGQPLKLFELAVGNVDPQKNEKQVVLDFNEVCKLFNIKNNKVIRFRNIMRDLMSSSQFVFPRRIDAETGKKLPEVIISPIEKATYGDAGYDKLVITFTDSIMPYITDLKREFTQYSLTDISQLEKKYSIILYKIIMVFYNQYENYSKKGISNVDLDKYKNPTISLSDLRELTDTKNKYTKNSAVWLQKVVKSATDEINEKTDFTITYDKIKSGRHIAALKFKVDRTELLLTDSSTANINDLSLDEKIMFVSRCQKEYLLLKSVDFITPIFMSQREKIASLYELMVAYKEFEKRYPFSELEKHVKYVKSKTTTEIEDSLIGSYLLSCLENYVDKLVGQDNNEQSALTEKEEQEPVAIDEELVNKVISSKYMDLLIENEIVTLLDYSDARYMMSFDTLFRAYAKFEHDFGFAELKRHIGYIATKVGNIDKKGMASYLLNSVNNREKSLQENSNTRKIVQKESLPNWARDGYEPSKLSQDKKNYLLVKEKVLRAKMKISSEKEQKELEELIKKYPELVAKVEQDLN
ncbi:replication initiation protein [Ligilactobacillus equi]|uniref:Replication protein b n=1 Tax=Ligilactobacillus equi DSM 15833 = JCM 10991 TaxID=1423740 RepID=A0A0R1TSM2_9LACO|nr:replication initiation protein [Ligilactobacillus equi]KRL84364.1 replication protein b [Ligilactobacillus equi DSM 15833 = JCM 10991]